MGNTPNFQIQNWNSVPVGELATSMKKDSVSKVAKGMKPQEAGQQPPTFLAPIHRSASSRY